MARAKTERHALVRAAAVSLALHLFAMPLFVRAGDPRLRGVGRDVDANETVRVATITFDRRTSPRRSTPPDNVPGTAATAAAVAREASASQPIRISPRVRGTPAPRVTDRRRHRPPIASRPSHAEPVSDAVAMRNVRVRDVSSATMRASQHANDQQANARVGPSSQSNSRASSKRGAIAPIATIALTLRTPAPERDERDATPPASAAEVVATPVAPSTASPSLTSGTASERAGAATSATPVVVARVAGRSADETPGGWGQTFARPLVADESELAALRSRFSGIRTIAIDVDASGRAIHVAIPANVTGDARAELARTLLALRYVPAECNGLRCPGTMQLAL